MAAGIRVVLTSNSRKGRIKEAAEAIKDIGLPMEKIEGRAVGEMTARDDHLYVCDPFEGDAFDHLLKLKCRIVGPQCLLDCLDKGIAVPKADHPIYSISMRQVTISCSSIEKTVREELHRLVEWMGGTVSKNFTDAVTHLIAGEVGSRKYHVAASLNTPVMLPEWVFCCWERGKDRHICATDDELLMEFACPVFRGCVICVTGLESDQRKEVRELTIDNGGEYTCDLKFNQCTHLVVNCPKGQKYEFARKWKIHCVTSLWLFDSISRGYCQDESLYPVVSEVQSTSTPNKSRLSARPSMANFSAISNVSMQSAVDDTAMTEANATVAGPSHSLMELDELDVTMADGSLFLDGCNVFLSGFSGARLEKLRRIINTGGATRFNQINESVSHVVMGDRVPEHVALLTKSTFRPHVVTAAWLVDGFKQGTLLSEEPYTCLALPSLPSSSPLTHSKSEKRHPSSLSNSAREPRRQAAPPKEHDAHEDVDVMQQYLPGNQDPNGTKNETNDDPEIEFAIQGPAKEVPSMAEADREEEDDDATQMDPQGDENDVTVLGDQGEEGIFSGKSFVILGFPLEQEEQILEMTVANGGRVKTAGTRCVADFAVVPINGCEVTVSVAEVVTNCWLQMCLEEEAFLAPDSNPLFAPILTSEDGSPLANCVLTVSQFSGVERDCLIHIAELLGATCQEYFSRKATAELKPNTHLLLREPSGSKYKAAKKWRVPAITKDWLLESAKKNERQPEKTFLVDFVPEDPAPHPAQSHGPELIDKPQPEKPSEDRGARPDSDVSRTASAREHEAAPSTDSGRPSEPAEAGPSEPGPSKAEGSTPKEGVRLDGGSITGTEPDDRLDANRPREEASVSKALRRPQDIDKENRTGPAAGDPPPRSTPVVNKHLAVAGGDVAAASKDTPSKFLGEGVVFHPAFDTKEALDYLESPAGVHHKKRHARKSSLPLDDFFHLNVAKAIQKTGEQALSDDPDETVFQEPAKSQGLLDGVVVCVSKKLIAKQGEYHAIAASLGAEFRWTFDNTCTHFIFKGRTNDMSKDYRAAKDKGIFIVSPSWLLACEEEERRVDEASYPHTFNPKMSLSVLSTKPETPARTTRQTRSMARTPRLPSVRTPKPKPPPQPRPSSSPKPKPQPPPQPQQHDETAMDGFEEGAADSDEELLQMMEAAEREEEEGAAAGEPSALAANEQGSLEQRENLQKQLEGIMSSTTTGKGGRRRSRIHKTSSTASSTTATDASNSSLASTSSLRAGGRRTRSTRSMVHSEEDGQAGSSRTLAGRQPEVHQEASQNVQITWDDPTGRKEREKVMAQLKRTSSPSQNDGDGEEVVEVSSDRARVSFQELKNNIPAPHQDGLREDLPSPTPRAPPIRLPVAKPPVAPQPAPAAVALPEPEVPARPQPKFLLSGMSQEEKIDYSALIEQLGGVVKDGMYFDPTCTHLVVGNPTRNEKYLASLATGKWVLHKSFFEACRQKGEFVEEEAHEWGRTTDLSVLNAQTVKLALAACRWREKLQAQQQPDGQAIQGAFSGWSVVLYIDRSKESSFKRILLAGGARVLGMRPPFSNLQDVTHAFMDLQKTKTPDGVLDLGAMATAGVLCLKPEYIAEFLLQEPVPDHGNYYINEIRPIMERLQDSRHQERTPSKRKRQDVAPRSASKKGRMR